MASEQQSNASIVARFLTDLPRLIYLVCALMAVYLTLEHNGVDVPSWAMGLAGVAIGGLGGARR